MGENKTGAKISLYTVFRSTRKRSKLSYVICALIYICILISVSLLVVTVLKIPEVCSHTFSLDKNELSTSTVISYNYSMWKKSSHEKGETCRMKFALKGDRFMKVSNVKVKLSMDEEDLKSECLFDMNILAYKDSKPLEVRNVQVDWNLCL